MFGSKPIVWDKCFGSGPCSDMPDEVAVGFGGSEVEPTAVQMEDRFAGPRAHRLYPKSRHAAEGLYFYGDVVARDDALHESIEWRACCGPCRSALGGRCR